MTNGGTLLIVDDDEIAIGEVVHLLPSRLNVRCARSIEEGYAHLAAPDFHPCGLLFGLDLKSGNSFDLLRAARTLHPRAPVAVAMDRARRASMDGASGLGATTICKPFGVDNLGGFLAAVIAFHHFADERIARVLRTCGRLGKLLPDETELLAFALRGSLKVLLAMPDHTGRAYRSSKHAVLEKLRAKSVEEICLRLFREALQVEPRPRDERGKLLLVDDNSGLIRSLDRVLGPYVDVRGACCVKDATDVLMDSAFRPKGLVFDMLLEDGSGIDLLKIAQDRHSRVPVTMLSGHKIPMFIDEAGGLGAKYLCKPVGMDHLAPFLASVLAFHNFDDERLVLALETRCHLAKLHPRETQILVFTMQGLDVKAVVDRTEKRERAYKERKHAALAKLGAATMDEVCLELFRNALGVAPFVAPVEA